MQGGMGGVGVHRSQRRHLAQLEETGESRGLQHAKIWLRSNIWLAPAGMRRLAWRC